MGHPELRESVLARKIGFGPEFVQRTTSPAVAEREAGFELREKPALEESFGSRGLGRSTLAGREVGQAFAQKERDINQLLAEATLRNLQQEKTDISERDQMLRALGLEETQQQNIFGASEEDRAATQRAIREKNALADTQMLNRAIGVPLSIGAAIATGNPALAMGAFDIDTGGMKGSSLASVFESALNEYGQFTKAPPKSGFGGTEISGSPFLRRLGIGSPAVTGAPA